jgi:putative membrane protein
MEVSMNSNFVAAIGAAMILMGSAGAASAQSGKAFLTDAIQGNLAEISGGELAQKKGNSDGVRSFGRMLAQDHSASNEKATTLAKSLGVALPTEPNAEAKNEYDKLSALSGDAFDKEFVNYMVTDHKKDIQAFQAEANGKDEVATFAKETLPTLQKHLATAQSLAGGKGDK